MNFLPTRLRHTPPVGPEGLLSQREGPCIGEFIMLDPDNRRQIELLGEVVRAGVVLGLPVTDLSTRLYASGKGQDTRRASIIESDPLKAAERRRCMEALEETNRSMLLQVVNLVAQHRDNPGVIGSRPVVVNAAWRWSEQYKKLEAAAPVH